jgi:hypothetical protein
MPRVAFTKSMEQRRRAVGRTSLVLNAAQVEFLERLCARFRRDAGMRFTKAVLIRILVGVLVESSIPFAEVRTETHLKEFLHAATRIADTTDSERWLEPTSR